MQSRKDGFVQQVLAAVSASDAYVNRSMIGTQTSGGQGLSSTGPKAGGPDYLRRFAAGRVVTVNTAAGGNAALLAGEEGWEPRPIQSFAAGFRRA